MRGWIRDLEASGNVLAGMCERGRIFNAGFAVFCAGFRRGERKCANRECASGDEFLTRGFQCSGQGFAGASGGVRAEMCERGRIFNAL